jgi:phospholipase C
MKRYIIVTESIVYDIKTSLFVIHDNELEYFIKCFDTEIIGGSERIKVILDIVDMKYYDGDEWNSITPITLSVYIGDYGL